MSSPEISVLTATRNAGASIRALHASLASQTYRNFEWIVADGLSNDATLDLVRDFAARDPWVRFTSEADFGLYDALNKALARAAGRYYVVAGADDIFEPDALAQYAQRAAQTGADVILARVIRAGKVTGGYRPRLGWLGHPKAFPSSHSIGTLFKRDLHERFGPYSRQFPLLADGYFLKILLRSGSVTFADADFVAGHFAEGGLTTTRKLQILAETWQIQMLTEPHPLLQTLIFFGKVLVRYPSVARELRQRK